MSTATPEAPAPQGTREQSRPSSSGASRAIPEAAKERFAKNLAATKNETATRMALAIAGLISDDLVVCPQCRKPAPKGKFKIHPDGGWKHFGSEGCHGDAVSVLQSVGITTGDAVRVLTGQEPRAEITIPENVAELASQFVGVKSRISLDVYNGVLHYGRATGGVAAAQEFYSQWHISPEAVERWGAVYIKDTKHFAAAILDRFGADKLIECGLFVQTSRGPYCLISDAFPIVEPHRHPATGDVLYMQLRGSPAQHQKYLKHKADPENVPYKGHEKFISLKGAPRAAQVGCGLHLIEALPHGSTVHMVEGFKDGLAGETLGLNAYGIPGVDFRPPEKICQLLARHLVYVALDGDEAGKVGRDGKDILDEDGKVIGHTEGLIEYLVRHGVDARPKDIGSPELGLDVTDFLVAGNASGKFADGIPCSCATCVEFRAAHPAWFPAA